MWGLVLKDYFVNRKTIFLNFLACILASCPIFIPVSRDKIAEEMMIFKLLYTILQVACIFTVFMVIASMIEKFIKEDEKTDWQNYLVSSPVMIKKQILVKYLELLFMYAFGILYGFFICKIIKELHGISVSGKITIVIFFFFLLQSSMELPVIFKVGMKYGNYIKMGFAFTIIFAIILYGLYGTLPKNINTDKIIDFAARLAGGDPDATKYFKSVMNFCKRALPIIAGGLYLVSFFLSCKLFNPEKTLEKE